ncbi:hypothetical protein BKA82DRAFT_172616 [Pisolithus tinctorius]|nr:hypothetical protein BKA82DRAFT_172616 [Pisolithus tinctorius]
MHKIPNLALGKVANRSIIRVFFPRMYRMFDSPKISSADLELIYNQCLLPTIRQFMPNQATHWPPSYNAALHTSRDQRGRFHLGSLDLPAHLLDLFANSYLNTLKDLRPYFNDAYFGHELRGWKAATVHNLDVAADDTDGANAAYERVNALDDLTHVLHMPSINPRQWLIDVGLEFGNPEKVVTWRHNGHVDIIEHLIPDLENAADVLERSSRYYEDHHMHLKDIAGFRWTPGRHSHIIKYIQAYTTEKAVSYQLHDGIFRPRKPSELISVSRLDRLLEDLDRQAKILFTCTGDGTTGDPTPQCGCARLEVRVPLNNAQIILANFPRWLINETMVQLPARLWW